MAKDFSVWTRLGFTVTKQVMVKRIDGHIVPAASTETLTSETGSQV